MRNQLLLFSLLLFLGCARKYPAYEFLPKEKFPQSWIGVWSGKLQIYSTKGLMQTVQMELEILPTDQPDIFTWALTYGEDQMKERRSYELKTINAEEGIYVIDEKNSIILESYLYHNKLISRFEVQGNLLICTYEKRKDQLIFEVMAGADQAINTTGGKEMDGDTIPEVRSFSMSVSQRAILKKG
ncbi:MAG: hypothetical protein AAF573_11090 [Bacteroidota bacterium]